MFKIHSWVRVLGGLLALLVVALSPRPAAASTYRVHECTAGQGSVPDAAVEGAPAGYVANNLCASAPSNYLQMATSGPVGAGQSKSWVFTAPEGTKINRATGTYLLQGLVSQPGFHGDRFSWFPTFGIHSAYSG